MIFTAVFLNSCETKSSPTAGSYSLFPQDFKKAYIHQWNLGIQKQIGTDWLAAGNYLGNSGVHLSKGYETHPTGYLPSDSRAIARTQYSPRSSPSHTNQRGPLNFQNPGQGQ